MFYVILCATAFIGAVIQGMSGFGFAIIMLMVTPYFFPYTEALALTAITSTLMVAYNLYQYRKNIVWKNLWLPMIVFGAADAVAIGLLKYIEAETSIVKLLGVMFIVLAVYFYFGQNKIQIEPTTTNAIIFNSISGLINGMFGVAGPLVVLYFMAVSKRKEEYMSTLQMFFFLTILIDVAFRTRAGMVTAQILQYGLLCTVFIIIGLWIGKKLFDKFDIQILCKVVYVMMAINGLWMIVS